jgi:hypothetical protein
VLQDWHEGEPQFSNPAVFTPAFKCTIQSGHFVKAEMNGVVYYGRIIATSHSVSDIAINERPMVEVMHPMLGYVKVNWYLKRDGLPFHNNRNNNTTHSTGNIYTSSVDELFQTPYFNWIVSSCVTELLFVFHYNDVICGDYCCSGMENAFFIRYRYCPETSGCIFIEKATYHPFPSCSIFFRHYWSSCLTQDVWEAICLIQQTITSILCRYSQNQGTHPSGHKKVCISVAVMQYLQSWLTSRRIIMESLKCHQMSSNIRDSLIYVKSKRIINGTMCRFDTEEKLDVLCRLLDF